MRSFRVTDLRYLEPEDPTVELSAPARRLRGFLGSMATAASARRIGELVGDGSPVPAEAGV